LSFFSLVPVLSDWEVPEILLNFSVSFAMDLPEFQRRHA